MSANLQQVIQERVRVLSDDEMRRVLDFMQSLRNEKEPPRARTISSLFEDLSSELPMEEWKELPSDGAENHDHFLYGAPKKPL